MEKRWIAFQLLTGLQFARERNVSLPSPCRAVLASSAHLPHFADLARRHQDRKRRCLLVELGLLHRLRLIQTHLPPPRRPLHLLLLLRHFVPAHLLPRSRALLRPRFRDGEAEGRARVWQEGWQGHPGDGCVCFGLCVRRAVDGGDAAFHAQSAVQVQGGPVQSRALLGRD